MGILPGRSTTTNNDTETLHHATFGGFARQSNGAFTTNITISVEDLIGLYSKTFEHNGHQLQLERQHLVLSHDGANTVVGTVKNDEGSTTTATNCCAAIDNDVTSSGDIELGRMSGSGDQKNRKRDDDQDDHDPKDSSKSNNEETTATLCFDRRKKNSEHTTDEEDEDGKKKQEESMIRCDGTCIICFEEFVPDDVIVWSENTDCNHVYHKECLVHYLATQALQMNQGGIHGSRQINVATNTCPTCRSANYCRVRDSEFMFLLIQKAEQYYTVSSRSSAAARIVAQRSPWTTTPPWPQTTPTTATARASPRRRAPPEVAYPVVGADGADTMLADADISEGNNDDGAGAGSTNNTNTISSSRNEYDNDSSEDTGGTVTTTTTTTTNTNTVASTSVPTTTTNNNGYRWSYYNNRNNENNSNSVNSINHNASTSAPTMRTNVFRWLYRGSSQPIQEDRIHREVQQQQQQQQ